MAIAVLAVGFVAAGCSSSSKPSSSNTTTGASPTTAAAGSSSTTAASAGNTASAPGVTPTTIKVALVTSLTGSDSSNSVTIPKGFAARIAAQNAAGGVDGRKITYVVEDDQSSPTAAATAAEAAVNAGAFAIDYNSPFAFGAIKYMAQAGIPVVGGAYDGPEWSQPQTFPNMFSWTPESVRQQPRLHDGRPVHQGRGRDPGGRRRLRDLAVVERGRQGDGDRLPRRWASRRPTSTARCRSARST